MLEKSENFNSLRPILFELCKKNYRGGVKLTPPPAGIGLTVYQINYKGRFFYLKKSFILIILVQDTFVKRNIIINIQVFKNKNEDI